MKRSLLLATLLVALVGCDGMLDPDPTDSTITIAGGDPSANGVLNGTVFGAEYGTNWDTLTSPIAGVTVEVYQRVLDDTMLMSPSFLDSVPFDTFPGDTLPNDTIPADTLPVDTLPVDTIVTDSIPGDSIPGVLIFRGSGVTDADGRFSVTGIPAGQYVIYIKPAASSRWAPSSGWTFTSDGSTTSSGIFHLWPKAPAAVD